MHVSTPSRVRSHRHTALLGLAALTLAAPVLATAPASAAPASAAPASALRARVVPASVTSASATPARANHANDALAAAAPRAAVVRTAVIGGVAPAAKPVHHLDVRAGRAGTKLRKLYVTVGVSSSAPAQAGHPRALVQRLRSGAWRTVGTVTIRDLEGPPVKFTWRAKKAATLRVTVPALGLVSPTMKVPAAPVSTKSRYYVRKHKSGDGGAILRVFKGGTAYGIDFANLEYSCLAGRLDRPWLSLTSFDFGGWRLKYRTTGSWKRLTIRDDATAVGGPRTSLTGTNKRFFGFCDAPTYAAVSTDPNGL